MHAAASYAHLELLEYLLSIGGDINLKDDDGDSPLYVVESVEMARWMVAHGADPSLTNDEGLTVRPILLFYPPSPIPHLHLTTLVSNLSIYPVSSRF